MIKNTSKFFLELLPEIKKNVSFKKYTTYKIGGPAKYFFIAKNKEDLIRVLKVAKDFKLPIFILGGGSNLLVSDKGFFGLVIKININDVKFSDKDVLVGAGFNINKLNYLFSEKNLSGLEWTAGLPGAVGGAVYGNAQAFRSKISDSIKFVEAVNIKTLKIKKFSKKQCQFSLKNSIFKKNKNLIIISIALKFKKGNSKEIKDKMKKFMAYRKEHHPISFLSAGSIFVNLEIEIKDKKLLEKYPKLKEFNKKKIIPSGYLIFESGLAGRKKGKAQISEKHANFIINLGGARAKDILFLIELAKKEVKKNFKIKLETEVQLIGF